MDSALDFSSKDSGSRTDGLNRKPISEFVREGGMRSLGLVFLSLLPNPISGKMQQNVFLYFALLLRGIQLERKRQKGFISILSSNRKVRETLPEFIKTGAMRLGEFFVWIKDAEI
ncbi:hypothetical protein TNCV_3717091 [Trichonephila clavipes]|nr:hypothetical protein TNCV_3717091 [Trichonephila clavipes]